MVTAVFSSSLLFKPTIGNSPIANTFYVWDEMSSLAYFEKSLLRQTRILIKKSENKNFLRMRPSTFPILRIIRVSSQNFIKFLN